MCKRRNRMDRKDKKRKSIKDKALIEFILQHSEKEEIDLSKVEIPSFIDEDVQKAEEEDSRAFRAKYCKSKSELTNSEKIQTFPTFTLSILDVIKIEENSPPSAYICSTLFQ